MKRFWGSLLIIVAVLFLGNVVVYNLRSARFETQAARDARFANVLKQQALLKTGRQLIKAGDFGRAHEKFNEALNPQYIESDFDKTQAISSKADLLVLQGKYNEALKEHNWVFERTPAHEYSIAKHKEILALIEWKKTADNKVIYDYISFLKKHFQEQIPPVGYKGYHTTVISTILRLYNTIGDHDAGIAYIDEILDFLRNRRYAEGKKDYEIYDRIKTVEQASDCMKVGPKDNLNWHGCKFIREYLKVREAFEQDKAEGFEGCAHSKPGEVCMGRATKALIESDYFPW